MGIWSTKESQSIQAYYMKIYLAGPMRGYPRYNFDLFEKSTQEIESKGVTVMSPHRIDLSMGFNPDLPIEDQDFKMEDAVLRDIQAIIEADAVYFLPRWPHSVGARAEYAVAKWLGRPCFQYPELYEL
jgi:nucleoside 2-deoxyribosyltransferase